MNIKDREMELFVRYQNGDEEAKRELLGSLKPLINSQVQKYQNSGLPVSAISLEGQRLALKAISTYDPTKAQLNTHVTNNLKKLNRYVTNYQNVGHIPEPRALMIGKYNIIYANLEAEKGREPTVEELSDAMQVSIAEIDRLQSELRKDLLIDVIEEDEDSVGFYEYISPQAENPRLKDAIEFTYFDADPVDKKILEYTLGLHGTPRRKAKEISMLLKLSENDLKKRKLDLAQKIKELL